VRFCTVHEAREFREEKIEIEIEAYGSQKKTTQMEFNVARIS